MPKIPNPEFKKHFAKLLHERGLKKADFSGKHVPLSMRLGQSTVKRAQDGFVPQRQDTINRFAAILKISPKDFITPPKNLDWVQPDVQQFSGDCSLRIIDGAIELHRGAEHDNQKYFWHIDDIKLDIEERPFSLSELKPFESVIENWAKEPEHKDEKRGMKYCVTEVIRRTTESSSKLVLKVRPIEYHLIKPINDKITSSFNPDGKTFIGDTESHKLRQKYFAQIPGRENVLIPNILTSQISVVTSDNKLILCKRRAKHVDSFRGCWSASIEEGFNADWRHYLKEEEVFSPLNAPDFNAKSGFLRALREELNLSNELIAGTQIQGLTFLVEFVNINTAIAAIAHVPISAEELLSGLKSHEEADCFAYCPFDLPCLLPVLLDKQTPPPYIVSPGKNPNDFCKNWKWHPTSRMRIFWSLANRYGLNEVTSNINRELKMEGRIK